MDELPDGNGPQRGPAPRHFPGRHVQVVLAVDVVQPGGVTHEVHISTNISTWVGTLNARPPVLSAGPDIESG